MADAISDTLTVYNPAGMAVQTLSVMESDEGSGDQVFYIGVSSLADPAQFGHATTLCESAPCNANTPRGDLSDIFGVVQIVTGGHTHYYLGFASDGENGIPAGTESVFGGLGDNFTIEMPSVPVDVTKYLDPTKQAAGWTAKFTSDGDVTSIPEPSTLVLLGTGLVGLAGIFRKWGRKQRTEE
jgi:hypothetical protein